jgi:hypothetical protein
LIDKELTLPKNAEENVIVEAQQSLCTWHQDGPIAHATALPLRSSMTDANLRVQCFCAIDFQIFFFRTDVRAAVIVLFSFLYFYPSLFMSIVN